MYVDVRACISGFRVSFRFVWLFRVLKQNPKKKRLDFSNLTLNQSSLAALTTGLAFYSLLNLQVSDFFSEGEIGRGGDLVGEIIQTRIERGGCGERWNGFYQFANRRQARARLNSGTCEKLAMGDNALFHFPTKYSFRWHLYGRYSPTL